MAIPIINYLESNQDAIEMIIKKNQVGLSALDYATMANNAKVAAFLAKLFYIFGQDVHGKDTQVSLLLNFVLLFQNNNNLYFKFK